MRMTIAIACLALLAAGCGSGDSGDRLTGTSWELVSIESMAPDEQPSTTIGDPAKYTVAFGDDGRAAFRVDCNRGNATWMADSPAPDSGGLTFGPLALTKMFCPPPSQDATVVAALDMVRGYLLSDGQLHMSMEADSGILHWRPAAAAP